MKITAVTSYPIAIPYQHGGPVPEGDSRPWSRMEALFVRVDTDEGISGWGEGFGFGGVKATKAALETLVGPLVVGREIGDIPAMMEGLRRRLHNFGRDGQSAFALAAVDVALWDIAGKAAGQPLWQLLGGKERHDALPAYASLLRYGDPALVAQNAAEALERGYDLIKLHEITEQAVAAAREVLGPDLPLMVDCNCPWTVSEAVRMAEAMAQHDLTWLEEPVWPPNDIAGLARLRREGGVPLAAGENAGSVTDFAQMIAAGAVDFLQPSVLKIGGVSEMVRLFALATEKGARVAPHSAYFGPGLLATIHLAAAQPVPPAVERLYCDLEGSPLGEAVVVTDGAIGVPHGPGLGVEVDEVALARYAAE